MAETEKKNLWQKMSEIQGMSFDIAKDKAAHGYSYATLDQIMDKLSPVLSAKGLLLYHDINYDTEEKCSFVRTIVLNIENPEEKIISITHIDNTIVLPGQNKAMVTGSLITYYRRYHVTSMFGLTTETDTDAGGAVKDNSKRTAGKSVDQAGVEQKVDFVGIFKNMIDKGKTKELVQKQFDSYITKMDELQIKEVKELIEKI